MKRKVGDVDSTEAAVNYSNGVNSPISPFYSGTSCFSFGGSDRIEETHSSCISQ